MDEAGWTIVYGSSNVKAIRYDEAKKECYVKFLNGDAVYVYEDVSPEEWESLVHSDSKGRYVAIQLKRAHNYHKES